MDQIDTVLPNKSSRNSNIQACTLLPLLGQFSFTEIITASAKNISIHFCTGSSFFKPDKIALKCISSYKHNLKHMCWVESNVQVVELLNCSEQFSFNLQYITDIQKRRLETQCNFTRNKNIYYRLEKCLLFYRGEIQHEYQIIHKARVGNVMVNVTNLLNVILVIVIILRYLFNAV